MISQVVEELIKNSSTIHAIYEEGKKLEEDYGEENVYNFSLGNPNVETSEAVKKAIIDIVKTEDSLTIHGYMDNSGYENVRQAIANHINKSYVTDFKYENILMTVGAAGGLNVILKTLLNPKEEIVIFAPYYGEYINYIANFDAKAVIVSADTNGFQLNLQELEKKITKTTKAVIVNSPNNPTGVVYSEDTLCKLTDILERKQEEFHTDIYLISDEPYRELVYDGIKAPYITKFYKNTIICYSYSKSLSLAGERIGYLVIPDCVTDAPMIRDGAHIVTRTLGFVNAPSLIQKVIGKCHDEQVDLSYYDNNRLTMYNGLKEVGFTCQKPEGAFYIFMKSPIPDEKEFCSYARKYRIFMVPGSSFGCPGYVRLAYCVKHETIVRAIPVFKKLAKDYGITGEKNNKCETKVG